MNYERLSIQLCYFLRHDPDKIGLHMDKHGWVNIQELITGINGEGKYNVTRQVLETIVSADEKGRYRISDDGQRIKCCQGHSIPWVELELTKLPAPEVLYHGTTTEAKEQILASGGLQKMQRHAVHMHGDFKLAWKSATRRKNKSPVVLKLDARKMQADGIELGVSENGVWCAESVPSHYIVDFIYSEAEAI